MAETSIADALAAVSKAHDHLVADVAALAAERDRLIAACYRQGMSLRDIARVSGLHFTRIRQIVKDRNLENGNRISGLHTPSTASPRRRHI